MGASLLSRFDFLQNDSNMSETLNCVGSFKNLTKEFANTLVFQDGRTCLHIAIWRGYADIAQWLMEAGASVNRQDEVRIGAIIFVIFQILFKSIANICENVHQVGI